MTPTELLSLMTALGLSPVSGKDKRKFARRLGITQRTVYRWLNGDTHISGAYSALIRERLNLVKVEGHS